MTAAEELLLAAEKLADAVNDHQEIHRQREPRRIEFDDGEEGEQEFRMAEEFYMEDLKSAEIGLARALRDYRRAQQAALSARAIRGVNDRKT